MAIIIPQDTLILFLETSYFVDVSQPSVPRKFNADTLFSQDLQKYALHTEPLSSAGAIQQRFIVINKGKNCS
jgi:hypothetical protein